MAPCDWRCLPIPNMVAIVVLLTASVAITFRAAPPLDAADLCPAAAPKAPLDFTLHDLDGKPFALSSLAGHVAIIEFWATWCGPCRVEAPALSDLATAERARGVSVVGIMVQDDFTNARSFARDLRLTYPLLDGTNRPDLERAFGPLSNLPTTLVLAADGRVCRKHIGLPPLPSAVTNMRASVRAVFAEEIHALLGGVRLAW